VEEIGAVDLAAEARVPFFAGLERGAVPEMFDASRLIRSGDGRDGFAILAGIGEEDALVAFQAHAVAVGVRFLGRAGDVAGESKDADLCVIDEDARQEDDLFHRRFGFD